MRTALARSNALDAVVAEEEGKADRECRLAGAGVGMTGLVGWLAWWGGGPGGVAGRWDCWPGWETGRVVGGG